MATAAPAKKGIIQWNHVIPALISVLVIFLLIFFLLDPFVKWVIIKVGQGIFGARVSIESVSVKLAKSRLQLRGMQVADKSSPMKNLFQFDEAVFDGRVLPLLEKKAIIDQASVNGLKFGTPRKTSGELTFAEKQPGFVGKAVGRLGSQVETLALDKAGEAKKFYDPKTVVKPDALQSVKAADKAKDQLKATPDDIKKQISDLNTEKRAEDIQKRIQGLGKGGNDPTAILQKAQEAKAIQADIEKLRTDIQTTRTTVTQRLAQAQAVVDDVKRAKEEDWKNIRSLVSLPSFDKTSIARALFGPAVAKWMERLLGLVHDSRQLLPAKPKSPPPPPRGRGRTIEFPRTNVLPRFLLAKASLSGEVGQERPFGFTGTLEGITTNPELYGKPAIIQVQGAQGSRAFDARALIDHTRQQQTEELQASYSGFSLNNMAFGEADNLGLQLANGTGRASGAVKIQGEALSGRLTLQGTNLTVVPKVEIKSDSPIAQRLRSNLTSSLSKVKALDVGVGVGGTLASPTFTVDSNIGSIVADSLKNALGAELQQQEQALRAELDRQTQAKLQELQQYVDGLKSQALGQLNTNNKVVDDLLNQVKQQTGRSLAPAGSGKPLDSFKGIFGR